MVENKKDPVISITPTYDYCILNPKRINNEIFKRFIDDLNKDRKKDITFFFK